MNSDIKCSIIICYVNTSKLQEAKAYVDKQSIARHIQLIAIDNSCSRFSSAAKALNYGAGQAEGEVLIFMHEDLYLWDDSIIERYCNYLSKNENTIAGVAGVAKHDGRIYGDLLETREGIHRLKPCDGKAVEAVTVDECMFAMTKKLWSTLQFDEQTCSNWHFYATDVCYANLLKNNGNVVILPSNVCHESLGATRDEKFKISLKKMIKKYMHKLRRIETTCANVSCSTIGYLFYLCKLTLQQIIFWVRK